MLHSLSQQCLAHLTSDGHLASLVFQQVVEDLVLNQEIALQVTQLLGRLVVATRFSQVEHEFTLLLLFRRVRLDGWVDAQVNAKVWVREERERAWAGERDRLVNHDGVRKDRKQCETMNNHTRTLTPSNDRIGIAFGFLIPFRWSFRSAGDDGEGREKRIELDKTRQTQPESRQTVASGTQSTHSDDARCDSLTWPS